MFPSGTLTEAGRKAQEEKIQGGIEDKAKSGEGKV